MAASPNQRARTRGPDRPLIDPVAPTGSLDLANRPRSPREASPTDFSRPKSPEEGPEERFSSISGRFWEDFRRFSRIFESTRAFFGQHADVEQTPRGASPNCSPQGGACGEFSEFRQEFVFLLCEKVRANSDGEKTPKIASEITSGVPPGRPRAPPGRPGTAPGEPRGGGPGPPGSARGRSGGAKIDQSRRPEPQDPPRSDFWLILAHPSTTFL